MIPFNDNIIWLLGNWEKYQMNYGWNANFTLDSVDNLIHIVVILDNFCQMRARGLKKKGFYFSKNFVCIQNYISFHDVHLR